MKLLQQKYAFQEPQNLVLNSFSCPHKDATLTVQEHASVVTQKSVINRSKKLKSVISIIKKFRYIQISQIELQSTRCVPVSSTPLATKTHAQFRCCMLCNFGCKYMFFQSSSAPTLLYGLPAPLNLVLNSLSCPHQAAKNCTPNYDGIQVFFVLKNVENR